MRTISQILAQLEEKLGALQHTSITKKVVVGFDGFVDSIRKAVESRDLLGVHHYKTLVDFADRIRKASGKSGQVEMDVQKIKAGGNAPILSATLANFNVPTTCIGSINHPVFDSLSEHCKTFGVLPPGESDAIEFDDGKLILSDLGVFKNYDWQTVKSIVGIDKLRSIINESKLIALVDWVNVEHAENIWEGLLQDVIKPSGRKDFIFFFDLCDPSKKSAIEIDDILDLISDFSPYGKVTLGLNENEALAIWSALTGTDCASVEEAGRLIHYTMKIDSVLIHPVDRSYVFTKREMIELPGRFVSKPKIQTGGGDNLNAGFILGQLAGFSICESMVLGMAASGSFVQEGRSPDIGALIKYIQAWRNELTEHGEESKNCEIRKALLSLPTHY